MPEQQKDVWDKAKIILHPISSALTAVVIALLGFFGSDYLNKLNVIEAKTQLYSQLMSKREEADSALRKEMFNSVINTFISKSSNTSEIDDENKVLALELLAYNFHDALDLSPLFKHVYRGFWNRINSSDSIDKNLEGLLERLERVAQDVIRKQVSALEEAGKKIDATIFFEEFIEKPGGMTVIDNDSLELITVDLEGKRRSLLKNRAFTVEALYADNKKKELRIKLVVITETDSEIHSEDKKIESIDSVFKLGFFDFPMIDNTRLSNGERCAVVLRSFEPDTFAEITLIYFPGSRASLKEKPYYEEIIKDLLNTT